MGSDEIKPEICYLCGRAIDGDRSMDHVPPKQFYSREIRKKHNPDLLRLPTHCSCNHSYQQDEEYFIHALGPLALKSYAGGSLFREMTDQYSKDRNVALGRTVFDEFEKRPSGLVLPDGKVLKRIDPDRVWRVVWKIVRGLYYHEYGEILPEDTLRSYELVSPGEKPPPHFFAIPDESRAGDYPGVFDYKHCRFEEVEDMQLWAFLLWDKLILLIAFHDPDCRCEECRGA